MSRRAASIAPWLTKTTLALVLFALVPLALDLLGKRYYFQVANTALLFIILSASMNLVTGVTGLMSLGHAAFYAVGAYAAALCSTQLGWPFWATFLAGGVAAGFGGLLVALPTMRLVSIYFAVATLGFGMIINTAILNWVDLTRGPMGVSGIGPITLLGYTLRTQLSTYYVIAAVAAFTLWVCHRLSHSYYGNALRSLREDDQVAAAMGVKVTAIKIQVFCVSTFLAGLAGSLLAHSSGFISPDYFRFHESILVLSMVVVGGLGSLPGSVIGALIMILLPEFTRPFGDYRMIAVGLVMFVSIMFQPKGLFGEVAAVDMARGMLGAAWKDKAGWK